MKLFPSAKGHLKAALPAVCGVFGPSFPRHSLGSMPQHLPRWPPKFFSNVSLGMPALSSSSV